MKTRKTLTRMLSALVLSLLLVFAQAPRVAASTPAVDRETLIAYARSMYFELEGYYGSVTAQDVDAVSIGFMQWHAENALYLLKTICAADPTLANQILGNQLYAEITTTPMWSSSTGSGWETRILTKPETVAVRNLIDTAVGRACQDRYARCFISGEIDHAIAQGVSTDAAIVYYCSIENQYGPNGAKTVLQRVRAALGLSDNQPITSLDLLHSGVLAAAKSYSSISAHLPYRKNVYGFLTRTLNLSAAPVEETTSAPDPAPESSNAPARAPSENDASSPGAQASESIDACAIKRAIGTVTASGLRLREGPTTASRILGMALRNEKVLVISKDADWCKVVVNQQVGYMHADYLSLADVETVNLGLARVNVCANIRSENHTGSAILDTVNRGNLCVITGFDHGWFRILCGGIDGYVRSDLVSLKTGF